MSVVHIISVIVLFLAGILCPENIYASKHVVTTPAHRFWVTNRDVNQDGELGEWVEAELLELGDRFRLSDGSEAVLTFTEPIYSHVESYSANASIEPSTFNFQPHYHTTYNFEVGSTHNYFVSESGVWVHNDCDGDIAGRQGGNFNFATNHRMRGKLKTKGTGLQVVDLKGSFAYASEFRNTTDPLPPIRFDHIFFGHESARDGLPIGFHSEGGRASILELPKLLTGEEPMLEIYARYKPPMQHPQGTYLAEVAMRQKGKLVRRGRLQSFFPSKMNHIEVLEAVWSAWHNWTFDQAPWRVGISYKEHLPIVMRYLQTSSEAATPVIRTAAPMWSLQVERVNNKFKMAPGLSIDERYWQFPGLH